MSKTQEPTTVPSVQCRTCGSNAKQIGLNGVGRPVYKCTNGHTQAGPFV